MTKENPLQALTERELQRIGFTEGATVTPEMHAKIHKMLMERDSKANEYAENMLHRTEQLIDIARMLMRPEDELPLVDRIKTDIEALKYRTAQLQKEQTETRNLDWQVSKAAKEAGVDLSKIYDVAWSRMPDAQPE